MFYADRIILLLSIFIGLALSATINFELHNERKETMNIFLTHDAFGNPIRLERQKIDGQSPELTQKIKNVSDILIQAYTQQELQFARMHPEAVPTEHFLKSLAPLFKDGTENVDWDKVEKQIKAIFYQFFTTTDFAQFSAAGETHFFVIAKDPNSNKTLGFIQFLINPEYPSGSIKAGMFGIMPEAQDRGLEKILMSSIFKLMPDVARIFVHTRATNTKELAAYASWGFAHAQQGYWVNSEYLAKQFDTLQAVADTLIEKR